MLAKQLQYLAGADAAGIVRQRVYGSRVLTSRADTVSHTPPPSLPAMKRLLTPSAPAKGLKLLFDL